ncbi:Rcb2.42 [Mycena leptocephala]|nr:Rcb2.42 [Mycena leptocephala]
MHPELAFGAFLASVLVLVPLPWHYRARNTTTLSMLTWLFVSNIAYGINAIIWSGRLDEVVPVWCDIVTKFEVGATAALPACCLSLALQLWRVSSASNTANKKKVLIVDLVLCWGYPAVTMALRHRFDIVEDFGCRPTIYVSVPAILLFYTPIAVVVILTLIFSGLAFRAFYLRRRTFTDFLHNKKSSFTARRYVRLMVITTVLAIWEAIVIGLVFGITFRGGIRPYTSWADVHFDFSRVDQYPTAFIPQDVLPWQYIAWWTIPFSGLSFFCSFSFGEDAVAEYGPWARRVARGFACVPRSNRVGPGNPASSTSSGAHLSLTRETSVGAHIIDIRPDFDDVSLCSADEVKMHDRNSSYPESKVDDNTSG